MGKIRGSAKFTLAENIKWRKVDDSIVILNVQDGSYFSMNETARDFFTYAMEGKTFDQLVHVVANEYEATEDQVREDAAELFGKLLEEKLLISED